MKTETFVKDTPALLSFGLAYFIIFGFILRRRIISYDFTKKSTFWFLFDNFDMIGGFWFGIITNCCFFIGLI